MDWSCCFCRSSSEMAAKAPSVPLIGVVGADLFCWRECNSSIVWAFTVGTLSSWQISLSFFWFVCIFASPFLPFAPALAKLNSPFSVPFVAIFHTLWHFIKHFLVNDYISWVFLFSTHLNDIIQTWEGELRCLF